MEQGRREKLDENTRSDEASPTSEPSVGHMIHFSSPSFSFHEQD
jgi:hypothetical protein